MPRPKRQTVFALPGQSLANAKATLQNDINTLLTAANMFVTSDPTAHPIAPSAHRVLEQLAAVDWRRVGACRIKLPRGWTTKAGTVVLNIIGNISNDDYHLRRCRRCKCWMLVQRRQRWLCNRPACKVARKKEADAERTRTASERRRRELALSREGLARPKMSRKK